MTELAAHSVEDWNPELEDNPHLDTFRVMTPSHASDLWLGELERQGHSERTVDTYRRLLNKFADDLPAYSDITDVSVVHIRKFLDAQSKRRDGQRKSPSTIAQNVSILSGLFDWLTKEGVVTRNPTRRNGDRVMARPRQVRPEDNDRVVTVSTDGVKALVAEANKSDWPERLAVNCLVYLGPRRRAVASLRISDYDSVGRMLTFHEKGNRTIEKPVPHALARLIEAAMAAGVYDRALTERGDEQPRDKAYPVATEPRSVSALNPDAYLVPSRASQRRPGVRDDRIIWRLVKDVADRAGVTTHVHALRAAFAVHFLENNDGELLALQSLMGHKRVETTLVYLRRMDRRQKMETVRELSWGEEDEFAPDEAEAVPVEETA